MHDWKPVLTISSLRDLKLLSSLDKFKRILVIAITFMMGVVLFLNVVELGYVLFLDIFDKPPYFILNIKEILEIFGLFLLVLIGIELFETMEIYIKENVVHIEVVLTVALIAVARKVIILDVKEAGSATLLGIAAIILALSVGYYLIMRTEPIKRGDESEE
jgi:uncharacterized membrane protein (DUF373 family)